MDKEKLYILAVREQGFNGQPWDNVQIAIRAKDEKEAIEKMRKIINS